MRKIILLMHVSLDGFVAGPNGEMDWIRINDEIFDTVGGLTAGADAALYGRVTYQMMDAYWLFINPVLLGTGIPLFKNIHNKVGLKLCETKTFSPGVIGLHYKKE